MSILVRTAVDFNRYRRLGMARTSVKIKHHVASDIELINQALQEYKTDLRVTDWNRHRNMLIFFVDGIDELSKSTHISLANQLFSDGLVFVNGQFSHYILNLSSLNTTKESRAVIVDTIT